jgi:hypothetical protein
MKRLRLADSGKRRFKKHYRRRKQQFYWSAVELLGKELEASSFFYATHFTTTATQTSEHFFHSKPDPLLAELFAKRSLPATDFSKETDTFLQSLLAREDRGDFAVRARLWRKKGFSLPNPLPSG